MHLTHTIPQMNKMLVLESALEMTVEYNKQNDEVEKVLSFKTYDYQSKRRTDITAIMFEHFRGQMDEMINAVDWREVYYENQFVNDLHSTYSYE